jgi:hypothetical protein
MEMSDATILSSSLPRVERKARIRVSCSQPLNRSHLHAQTQEFGRTDREFRRQPYAATFDLILFLILTMIDWVEGSLNSTYVESR